jgi:hypothetical protein
MRSRAAVAVASALATAIVLVGVVAALRANPAPAAPTGVWAVPDADGLIRFSDVVTRPVPDGTAAPKLNQGDALLVAHRLDLDTFGSGEPRVTLRLASRPLTGDAKDGFQDRLSWIIEYPNSPMLLFGPPDLSQEQRAAMEQSGVCEFVVVVDANTAVALTSMQVCHPKQ